MKSSDGYTLMRMRMRTLTQVVSDVKLTVLRVQFPSWNLFTYTYRYKWNERENTITSRVQTKIPSFGTAGKRPSKIWLWYKKPTRANSRLQLRRHREKTQVAKANGEHKKNVWEIIDVPNLYWNAIKLFTCPLDCLSYVFCGDWSVTFCDLGWQRSGWIQAGKWTLLYFLYFLCSPLALATCSAFYKKEHKREFIILWSLALVARNSTHEFFFSHFRCHLHARAVSNECKKLVRFYSGRRQCRRFVCLFVCLFVVVIVVVFLVCRFCTLDADWFAAPLLSAHHMLGQWTGTSVDERFGTLIWL